MRTGLTARRLDAVSLPVQRTANCLALLAKKRSADVTPDVAKRPSTRNIAEWILLRWRRRLLRTWTTRAYVWQESNWYIDIHVDRQTEGFLQNARAFS